MRTENLERLALAIEEDRRRRIAEVEKTFDRKLDALALTRALFDEYGTGPEPEPTVMVVPDTSGNAVPEEASPETPDPHDAGGSVEEERPDELEEILGPVPEEAHESPEAPPGKLKKPCKECGVPKTLDEFYKQPTRADGHDGTCKRCRAEQTRNRKEKRRQEREGAPEPSSAEPEPDPAGKAALSRVTTLPRQKREPEPERSAPVPQKKARYCRNGKECVSYPHLEEPTKLNSGNKGSVCYKCEEKKTALGSRPVGTLGPLVRKAAAAKVGAGA